MAALVPLPESQKVTIEEGNFFTSLSNAKRITIRDGNFFSSLSNAAHIEINNANLYALKELPRNLVLCFDGTTNKFGKEGITNVVRIYELLRKDDGQQYCYYQPGIGTYDAKVPLQRQSASLLSKMSLAMEAAFANDIRKHILGGYKFLMTHYRSGDRIYKSMLEKVGLLSFGNDEQVDFAWDMYKQGHLGLAENFRKVFCQDVQVLFLGLWETVKSTRKDFSDPQNDSFVSYVYHALALDERRVNFQPHHYRTPGTLPNNQKPPTRVTERWFVGDHSDIGGRFAFESLDNDALANPPFRWVVWAAACAAGELGRSFLLFNDRAFVKYFPILLYHGTTDSDLRKAPEYIITTDYFYMHPPSDDSGAAATQHGRPVQEVRNTRLDVHDGFSPLSIWKTTQAFHGRGLHGNRRNLTNAILHASVRGKLTMAPRYGGKNRTLLQGLGADEGVWGVFGVGSTPITFRV